MEPFSSRLKAYLKENNISQYNFAKAISQDSQHNFESTLRKVQRWCKNNKPRPTTFEGAKTLKIIQNWEKSKGIHPITSDGKILFQTENERKERLDIKKHTMESLSFFERRKIIDKFCNSGLSFSSVLNPKQEKIIRWYFGLNKSQKKLNKSAIGRKLKISPSTVRGILLVSLRRLKYPHLPVGKSFQSETFQKGRRILDDFFKSGRSLSDVLNKRRETFIRLRYGLDGRKPLSMQAISKQFQITRESVRKSIVRSLRNLK